MNQPLQNPALKFQGVFLPGQMIPVFGADNVPVLVPVPNPDDPQLKPLYKWGKPKTLRYAVCSIIHNMIIHPLQPVADLLGFVSKWLHALHDRTAPG